MAAWLCFQLDKDVPDKSDSESDEELEERLREAKERLAQEERSEAKAQLNRWKVCVLLAVMTKGYKGETPLFHNIIIY